MTSRRSILACVLAGAVMGHSATLAQTPPLPPPATPRVHRNACDLADSMASKLANKGIIEPARAQQTCQMLMPTMKDEDAKEFMRCCVQRLAKGPSTAPGPHPPAKAAPDGRQGT